MYKAHDLPIYRKRETGDMPQDSQLEPSQTKSQDDASRDASSSSKGDTNPKKTSDASIMRNADGSVRTRVTIPDDGYEFPSSTQVVKELRTRLAVTYYLDRKHIKPKIATDEIANRFDINPRTLRHRIHMAVTRGQLCIEDRVRRRVFTRQQENELAEFVKAHARLGHGWASVREIQQLAEAYAMKHNNRKIHKNWTSEFIKRRPDMMEYKANAAHYRSLNAQRVNGQS